MSLTETFEPRMLRRIFGVFPTGVAALAALVADVPAGIAVSSFTSVSLDPALVLVCVSHSSSTWPLIAGAPRLGVSVLAAGQQRACEQLSAKGADRFTGLGWRATTSGAVLLDGAGAWFECSVEQVCEAGDHDIVVLRVHDLDADHSVAPLVFHASRLRSLHAEHSNSPEKPGRPERMA